MPAHAPPAETDILCEHCGYGLNGLPETGLCPECGQPIADSTVADRRMLPPWEREGGSTVRRFLATTAQVIVHPARFFRSLATRTDTAASQRFASRQYMLSAVLLGLATTLHMDLFWQPNLWSFAVDYLPGPGRFAPVAAAPIVAITWFCLTRITRLATFLTRVEGGYWGYRLPQIAVQRAMHYHSAQLLPVAAVFFVYIVGYRLLQDTGVFTVAKQVPYLYILSGLVVVAAFYLFRTYWIAMKNIMYANR